MRVQEPPLHAWSITLSVGDQPCCCSGLQLITKRDPALTLDEQIMQEYEASIRRVQEYWDLQQTIMTSPPPPPSRPSAALQLALYL